MAKRAEQTPTFDFADSPTIVSFDIEIADEFELAPGEDLDSKGPFAIACAAAFDDRERLQHWYARTPNGSPDRQLDAKLAREMLDWLRAQQTSGVKVCAWNGLGFDLKWLGVAADAPALAAEIALELFDPMFQFVVQRGFPIALASVAAGFAIEEKKLMRGADAPKEWARGDRKLVLDYVAGDCRITTRVVERILAAREIRWLTKKGTLSTEPIAKLAPVRELLDAPLPDTSWMREPLSREKFYAWILPHTSRR